MPYPNGFIIKLPKRPGYDPTTKPSPYPNTNTRRRYMRRYMANLRKAKKEKLNA